MPKRITIRKDPRHAYRKRKYGITPEHYEQLLQQQDRKCAICKKEKPLVVDHSHYYGSGGVDSVRGLICWVCNCALGMFKDDVAVLESAIAYLKHHWAVYHERVSAADAALDEELW